MHLHAVVSHAKCVLARSSALPTVALARKAIGTMPVGNASQETSAQSYQL